MHDRPRRGLSVVLLALCLSWAMAASGLEVGEIELTSPVRQQLGRLQETWKDFTAAYYKDDEELARSALTELLAIAGDLGMSKIPELSIASAAFAVDSVAGGDGVERARWAVDCARQLDPGRPEADFASATVERRAGNYIGAVKGVVAGYSKMLRLPIAGRVWRQNLGLWGLYLAMLTSGFFLLLQMGHRGTDLFYDLGRLVSPPLPRVAADVVAVLLLFWPLILPSGLLWLALYWSILIWGYCSVSQRGVLILLWLVFGLAPFAISHQQREIQRALLPPTRAIENLKAGRLYGGLLTDVDVLRNLVQEKESSVGDELVADLHRSLGQWEQARLIYNSLIETEAEDPKLVAPAQNNLGVYHYRKGDFGTAVTYFTRAAESTGVAPPSCMAETWFNLSQAHNENFNFTEAHQALAKAKRCDATQVFYWESSEGGTQGNVIPINGGLRRAEEIQNTLAVDESSTAQEGLASRRNLPAAVAVAAIVLAVALHLLRRQKGYPSSKFAGRRTSIASNPWLCGLLPGWESTLDGRGVKALTAILLPMSLLLAPTLKAWGYRPSLGYIGPGFVTLLCIAALVIFLVIRVVLALRAS